MAITTTEAIKRYGVTQRELNYWTSNGFIIATQIPGVGRGGVVKSISWDEEEVLEAMVLLVRAGMRPSAAAEVARGLDAPMRKLQLGIDKARAIAARRRSLASGGN